MKTCKIEGCGSSDMAARSSLCKVHHREYVREHYRRNKEYYVEKAKNRNALVKKVHQDALRLYLSENPCVDCGNCDIEVLQFDHREPSEKVTEVARLVTGSTSRMWQEVSKCDVRCANCHVKKTRRQFGWWIND